MGGVSGGAPSGATPGKGGRPQASPFFAGNGRSFATWSPERAACSSGNPVAPCGSRELDSNLRAGRLGLCTEFPCTAATLLPCNPHLLTQVSGGLAELGRSYTAWPTQPCDPASAGSLPTPGLTQGTEQAGARKTWVCTPTPHCRAMTPPPLLPRPTSSSRVEGHPHLLEAVVLLTVRTVPAVAVPVGHDCVLVAEPAVDNGVRRLHPVDGDRVVSARRALPPALWEARRGTQSRGCSRLEEMSGQGAGCVLRVYQEDQQGG